MSGALHLKRHGNFLFYSWSKCLASTLSVRSHDLLHLVPVWKQNWINQNSQPAGICEDEHFRSSIHVANCVSPAIVVHVYLCRIPLIKAIVFSTIPLFPLLITLGFKEDNNTFSAITS